MESVPKSARLKLNPNSMSADSIEDFWQDIFLRLPVESLCRFRSVCKSWNSLISSSFFINLHHSFTRATASSSEVYNLRHDLRFPFQFRCDVDEDDNIYCIQTVDVIHGLVCISYTLDSTFDSTIIWNPAIHRYFTLPPLPFPSHIDSVVAGFGSADVVEFARFYSNGIGFGYDRIRDDLKVVRIWMNRTYIQTRVGFIPTTYEVYSTRQGAWRMATADSIQSWLFDFSTSTTGCFVNGSIHWLVSSYDFCVDCVLMFDCEREELTTVDLPQELYEPKITWLDPSLNPGLKAELLEYGGMLSALVHRRWEDRIELWVMKEHGLPSTWSKLFTMDRDCDVLGLYQPSFLKMAPHGSKQWVKFDRLVDRFRQVYGYQETMFLLDDTEAKSYSGEEIVDIFIPAEYSKA